MFDLVPSKYMRKFYKESGFEFTDFQKATLIWNAPDRTWKEILDALNELAEETVDDSVKQQISERIAYEKNAFAAFLDNSDSRHVYVVEDYEDGSSCGFFQTYEMALKYAVKYAKKYETQCSIQKQLIVRDVEDETVRNPMRGNPNMGFKCPEYSDYDGAPIGRVLLNKEGKIMSVMSSELPEEEKVVDEYKKERFEYAFMKVPFAMQVGILVRNVVTGDYGVLAQGKEHWDEYMQRIEDRNLYVDFSDVQVIVYKLTEKGYWSHEHINPMYLEVGLPAEISNDKKTQVFQLAAEALGNYLRNKNQHKDTDTFEVIKYAKEYALLCREEDCWNTVVEKAEKPEDIIW